MLYLIVGVAAAQGPSFVPKPIGNLKQVMRSILYPNSNTIFDVQKTAPKNDAEWITVQNSAIALAESASLITMRGRLREDGKPVPVERSDWVKFSRGLVDAANASYKAAKAKDKDAVSESTDKLSEACSNCHEVYRDKKQ